MRTAGIHKRWKMYGLSVLLLLTLMLGSGISVSAASSSIARETVRVSVAASGTSALKIRWNKVSNADGYIIYRRESQKKPFKLYRKIASRNTTVYLDRSLPEAKVYQYAVRAYHREKSKYILSKYVCALGATRPSGTTATIKAVSSSQINISWKSVSRADGYRIYRNTGGKWSLAADVSASKTFYSDNKAEPNTKYAYTVRAYKKAGNVKYLGVLRQSNTVTTPKKTTSSNSGSRFNSSQKDVMKKILYAVETGGQIYGNQDYRDFTQAYTNSKAEHAITIGAGQWYATEAQRLLKLIHTTSPETYKKYDPKNEVWNDVVNKDWSTYQLKKSSDKAKIIVNLISSPAGIKCQDQLMYEQIDEYEKEIRQLGVTDHKAVGECINIRHQGGFGAVTRILGKTKGGYTLDNIYKAMSTDTGNQVGTYKTRQEKVYRWLKTYMN